MEAGQFLHFQLEQSDGGVVECITGIDLGGVEKVLLTDQPIRKTRQRSQTPKKKVTYQSYCAASDEVLKVMMEYFGNHWLAVCDTIALPQGDPSWKRQNSLAGLLRFFAGAYQQALANCEQEVLLMHYRTKSDTVVTEALPIPQDVLDRMEL